MKTADSSRDPVLNDFVQLVKRNYAMALLVALICAAATFLISGIVPARYQATSVLLLPHTVPQAHTPGSSLVTAALPDARAYQIAGTSPALVSQMLQAGGVQAPTMEEVERASKRLKVSAEADDNSSLVVVSVVDESAERAATMANALASGLLSWDQQRANAALEDTIGALEVQLAGLAQQLEGAGTQGSRFTGDAAALRARFTEASLELASLEALRGAAPGPLEMLTPATAPFKPVTLDRPLQAALAFFLGFVLVIAIAVFRSALDPRFRSAAEAVDLLGLPVLAQFRRSRSKDARLPAEVRNQLRTSLSVALGGNQPLVVLVTSPLRGEGKSDVAFGVAKAFAQVNERTLLVDANLHDPATCTEFKITSRPASAMNEQLRNPRHEVPPVVVSDGNSRLHVVPGFRESGSQADLLARSAPVLLERWGLEFDVIIIDSAAVLPFADALSLARLSSGVLVVVDAAATRRQDALDTVTALKQAGGHPVGLVIRGLDSARKPTPASRSRLGLPTRRDLSEWTVEPKGAFDTKKRTGAFADVATVEANGAASTATRQTHAITDVS